MYLALCCFLQYSLKLILQHYDKNTCTNEEFFVCTSILFRSEELSTAHIHKRSCLHKVNDCRTD